MSECPIGLICESFEEGCREYCELLAKPWPLPFFEWSFRPGWREDYGFVVCIPARDEYAYNALDYELGLADRHNAWADRVRQELWRAGWWMACGLPYEYHPDGGIKVISRLPLDDDVTFACPWFYDSNLKCNIASSYTEEFIPAVHIDSYKVQAKPKVEADGFFNNWYLYWPKDYDYEE